MVDLPAPGVLRVLETLESKAWDGTVWRHMFGDNPPTRENRLGARWNPPGVPAIYASLDRSTALVEGKHAAAIQPLRPTVKRTIYKLLVRLGKVLDLSSRSVLLELGINEQELANVDHTACQRIGGAVEWLEKMVYSSLRLGAQDAISSYSHANNAPTQILR